MKILSIETSCDDTGIAILEIKGVEKSPNFSILSNIVASQIKIHKKYGGVFPMMAKREHQRNLLPTLVGALKESKLLTKFPAKAGSRANENKLKIINSILERESDLAKKLIPFLQKYKKPDIDLIAVTNGPGLEPCLWVGVNFAKALSYVWDIPVIPVNHIESHILVNFLQNKEIKFPAIALVVSGGHTQLILVNKIGKYKILGETRDDAAGECFDKCAKILGLSYPGGPEIAKLASKLDRGPTSIHSIQLPRPMINTKDYDFSFSGLKTAVLYLHQKQSKETKKDKQYIKDMSAEIQQAIIDVLIKKTMKAVKDFNAKTIILGGGVSANQELRKQFEKTLKEHNNVFLPFGKNTLQVQLLTPSQDLSTDNGLMIAITGYFNQNEKIATSDVTKLKANANLRIG